jgi:hypothetical protein
MIDEQHNLPDSEYIIIPNPIYDVVFRYLMEDPESAMIVLSTLINEKITSLQLERQTHAQKNEIETKISDPKSKKEIHLFHLDFTATIELPDGGEELIMIELQKASEPDDIFRFKRYISKNFQKKHEKEIIHPVSHTVEKILKPIRLIPIFILNFRIENEINDLLIRKNRIKTGVFKNNTLQKTNEFIDNLSCDILVVQLPNLHNITESEYEHDEYKKKLFALLKLFDQNSKLRHNDHRIRLVRSFFPISLKPVINRLQWAVADFYEIDEHMFAEDEHMFAEDEHLRHLISQDNLIAFYQNKLDFLEEQEQVSKTKQEIEIVLKQENALITELTKTIK